jgi:long-chain acyl-CoA synthetase
MDLTLARSTRTPVLIVAETPMSHASLFPFRTRMSETDLAMPRHSLLEYFQPNSRPEKEIAVTWRRGYRMVPWSYGALLHAADRFARELERRGIQKGDRVLLWGENSGEWVAAFLGCLFRGAVAVPMDAIADASFAGRVARQAGVRLAVLGRGLSLPGAEIPTVLFDQLSDDSREATDGAFTPPPLIREDLVEIVFTSGTTSEPRGVALTHGNLLANLEPLEKEIARYRRYERFVHPLRFLDLLPLSHVFGQLLGIFLSQILGGTTVFLDTLNPAEVIHAIHQQRVSVLVTVPRLVESLRDQIERDLAASGRLDSFRREFDAAEGKHFFARWWRFREIHRRFGWKFWAIISGGAALAADAEQFWKRVGYAVIQGYGLTETTSLVSVNHPFRIGQGSIGKSLPGLEVKLSDGGEILVRGENVASGYWKDSAVTPVLDADGWFHTGDLGERDAEGNLYFKGRQKNVIVTPAGLNIYPEDLEAELRKEPEVRDCVVVGLARDGNAEPCAVLLLREQPSPAGASSASDAEPIVQRANSRLAPFQQMRRWMVWRDSDFPRTPTQKPVLRRIEEAAQAELGGRPAPAPRSSPIEELLSRVAHGADKNVGGGKLQLSSIERVELMSALEDRYQVDLSEASFTQADTVASLDKLLAEPLARAPTYHYPRWAQSWPMRWIRAAAFYLVVRPAMFLLGWPRVRGRERLRGISGPVLVAANHIAFIDPGFVLQALPARLRRRLAVAMDGELLETMRKPPEGTRFFSRLLLQAQYLLVVILFNVFPLPQRAGFRKSFAFAGELIDRGWSVLVFPEGVRTRTGQMSPFRAGIGLLATRLGVPVVPVRLDGLFERKVEDSKWARPGEIKVTIGTPVSFSETTPAEEIARDLQQRVAALAAEAKR